MLAQIKQVRSSGYLSPCPLLAGEVRETVDLAERDLLVKQMISRKDKHATMRI